MNGDGPSFCIMPSAAVFDPRLTDRTKCVLMALAAYANKDRVCIVGQTTLAKRLGTFRQRVNEAVTDLAEYGYLEIFHRGAQGRRGRGSNGYRLLFDNRGIFVTAGGHKPPIESPSADTNTLVSSDLSPSDRTQLFVSGNEGYLCPPQRTALTVSLLTGSVSGESDPKGTSFPEQREQDRFARPSSSLVEPLSPQTERRDLWRQVKAILLADGTIRGARTVWLDTCALYEPQPHSYTLTTATTQQRDMVRGWTEIIHLELQRVTKTDCTLGVECAKQKQRSTVA